MDLIKELQDLKRRHRECDDSWYSCPLSEEGCADPHAPKECMCGAEDLNKKIDEIMAFIQKGIKSAPRFNVTPDPPQEIKAGPYTITPWPPNPTAGVGNSVWIQKDDGEGQQLDLDKLWKDF